MWRWDRSSDQGEDGSSSITRDYNIGTKQKNLQKKNVIIILRRLIGTNYCKGMTRKSSFRQSDITKALRAAKDAGFDISVPFTGGRGDATDAQTDAHSFEAMEPKADGTKQR